MTRMVKRGTSTAAVAALAVLAAAPAAVQAQSAKDVLETALERYEQRMEGVDNYTIVQQVMGFESTTYMERVERDGHTIFVPRSQMGSDAAKRVPQSPYTSIGKLAERARLEGTREVDGESCHVVVADDLEGTELAESFGQEGSFQPKSITFLVDTDDYLVRQMHLEGTSTAQGEPQDVTFDAHMRDYRDVQGVVHPFRMDVSVEGMSGGMSEQDRQQMKQAMEQMKNMPEQQRQMMEQMMGDQLEQMEQMLATGAMDFSVEVKEIRVNEGPPGGGS